MKRRKLWPLLAALLLAALAGCGRSSIDQIGPVLDDWRYEGPAPAPASAKPSEITPAENGDFSEVLGFRLSALPEAEGLAQTASWAIDWFGQVEYQTDVEGSQHNPWTLVVRVAPTGGRQLAGTYNEGHTKTDEAINAGGQEVQARTDAAGCALYTWEREGFQFSLHSNKLQGPVQDGMLALIVEGLQAESTGAVASFSAPAE